MDETCIACDDNEASIRRTTDLSTGREFHGMRARGFDTPGVLPQGVAGVCNVVTGVPDNVD